MRKSIPAFVFGLIGSIFALWWGFVFGIVGDFLGLAGVTDLIVSQILGWICFIGAIIGIIGASTCIKKARKGGILMIVATVMCGALLIYIFINAIGPGAMIPTLIILFLLPVILMTVSLICALIAKEVSVPANQNFNYIPNPQANVNVTKQKSLEQELTELKTMFDKNLLTEEEYSQAKKNVIEKHSK